VIVGLDRRVQYANPASLAMSGQPMEEFRPSPSDFAGPSKEKALEIWKAVENGKIWNGRMKGRKADGTDFSIDFSLTPVRDGSGRIICYLGVGRDISREMMMQERVSHGQKLEAMGTLAGGIAHDFNNILTAIFGYTELSIRSADSREKQERYLMEILNASKRARELVNHILAFSRRSETVEKVIVPKYIIKEALTLLRASLPSTIEIRENLLSPAQIKGDPTRLHQMTMNLCTNAWYAMREHGGILEVSLEEIVPGNDFLANHPGLPSGPCLELRISDTGSGIPSGIIERIFDPFFTTKPAGEGTGLGLSVVHGTVLSMKGVITVRSEEGKGTVFSVYLPVAHDVMECGDEEAEEGLLPGSERILLLDDEKSIAESVMELLKRQGYSVSAFTDSALAWERFSGTPEAFDAVITDYTMPHMTGVEFATRIRGLRRDIPVIICSGNFSLEEKLEEIGNVEFVKKPVMIQELSGCLRRMLDRAAPGDKGEC
jgi:PAS domain S-box-containing protein